MVNLTTPDVENKIVDAIRRVSTLHKTGSRLDMDRDLASALSTAGVSPTFAKTAAQAANKSLSVSFFTKNAEDARAVDFQLFNPERVEAIMIGDEASTDTDDNALLDSNKEYNDQPEYTVSKAAMLKVASEVQGMLTRTPMEDNLTVDEFLNKVANACERVSRDIQDLIPYSRVLSSAYTICKEAFAQEYKGNERYIAQALNKQASEVIPVLCDAGVPASHIPVVKWSVEEPSKFHNLIKTAAFLRRDSKNFQGGLVYAALKLEDLEKTAGQVRDRYLDGLAYTGPEIWSNPMRKLAGEISGYGSMVTGVPGALVGSLTGGLAGTMDMATDIGGKADAYNNWRAGNTNESFSKVLDTEFMLRDRKLDRLAAWADIMADPALKGYKATQLHTAVNRVMDANRGLESPGNRELLRANVKRALVQSGELSTADLAAMAKTLSDTAKGNVNIKDKIVGDASAKGYSTSAGTTFSGIADALQTIPDTGKNLTESIFGYVDLREKNYEDRLRREKEAGDEKIKIEEVQRKRNEDANKKTQADAASAKMQAEAEAAAKRGDAEGARKLLMEAQAEREKADIGARDRISMREDKTRRDIAAGNLRAMREYLRQAAKNPGSLAGVPFPGMSNPDPLAQGAPRQAPPGARPSRVDPMQRAQRMSDDEVLDWWNRYQGYLNTLDTPEERSAARNQDHNVYLENRYNQLVNP